MGKKFQFITAEDADNFTGTMDSVGGVCMYYQVTTFPNPKTNRYHVRKFVINESNEFVSIKDYYLSTKTRDRLTETKRPSQYKLFNVYNLETVVYPNMNDIMVARSDLVKSDADFTGFASF